MKPNKISLFWAAMVFGWTLSPAIAVFAVAKTPKWNREPLENTSTVDSIYIEEVAIQGQWIQSRSVSGPLIREKVGRAFLRRQGGASLMHSLQAIPGVQALSIGSGQAKPMIRGLAFNQVAVIDDGVKHHGQEWGVDHGLEVDAYRIGQAEIIKGPAAFRYGSDAIGGTILLLPPEPPAAHTSGGSLVLDGKSNTAHLGGSLGIYTSSQRWYADARITATEYGDTRVPTDTVFIYDYAVALAEKRLRNTAGKEIAYSTRVGYRTPTLHTWIVGTTNFARSGFFANAHGLEPRQVNQKLHDRSSRDIELPRQTVTHWKINTTTEIANGKNPWIVTAGLQRNQRLEENVYVGHGYMPPVFPAGLSFSSTRERFYDKRTLSASVTNEFAFQNQKLTWGSQGEWQHNQIDGWNFLSPAFRQFTAGIFVVGERVLNPHTVLHGATRYDYSEIHTDSYRDWFRSVATNPPTNSSSSFSSASPTNPTAETNDGYLVRAIGLKKRFDNFNGALGLHYRRASLVLVVHVGTSFRLPIAKELAANGVNYHYFRYEKGDPTLSPERAWQVDVGIQWSGDRWSAQIDPFMAHVSNYIYLNPTAQFDYTYGAGNQIFQYSQANVLRWGGETRLQIDMAHNWMAMLSGEALRTRQLSGPKKGFGLPFSPPSSLTSTLRWKPAFTKLSSHTQGTQITSIGALHQFYFDIDYRLTRAQRHIVPPEKMTPGSHRVDVSLGGKWVMGKQPIELGLRVLNLFDAYYLNHLSFYRLIDLPEAGRSALLTIHIPFKTIKSSK